MNVMIVTNSKYLKPAYIMLYSLFVNHDGIQIDVYLPYEDLTDQELLKLREFVESFPEKRLYPLYVGTDFKKRVTSRSGINIETYYRIVGIELLPKKLERILYLDVDMIIKGSLLDLYEMDITDHPFVVCEDIYGVINGFHEENKVRLGIPKENTYFNAGVMLYNLMYLRREHGVEHMLEAIYNNYERYVYNDQDVMNELYYQKLLYVGWDEYNCPPAWYYLNKEKLAVGELKFANYQMLQEQANQEKFAESYQNVTRQIYESAKIIHYLANTKPWNQAREQAVLFDIFDAAYREYEKKMQEYRGW